MFNYLPCNLFDVLCYVFFNGVMFDEIFSTPFVFSISLMLLDVNNKTGDIFE